MFEYESKEIDEKKLEDMVRQAPHLIQEGLGFVARQRLTGRGPLDVLLVESEGTLVVAELKVVPDDGMLMQALDYYDYVSTNLDGFRRVYENFNIDATQSPKLMLIAPNFSQALINRCKWISDEVRISLFSYKYIVRKDTNEDTIVFLEIKIPPKPTREEEYSIPKLLRYIQDDFARQSADKFLKEVRSWNPKTIEIAPRKWHASIWLSGETLAHWWPLRKLWTVHTKDMDGTWRDFKITLADDYQSIMALLRSNFEKQGGKFVEPKEV